MAAAAEDLSTGAGLLRVSTLSSHGGRSLRDLLYELSRLEPAASGLVPTARGVQLTLFAGRPRPSRMVRRRSRPI
jgi:hypothetical protein